MDLKHTDPSEDDWVGVFSPAKFNGLDCYFENEPKEQSPYICSAPIKYKYANHSTPSYTKTDRATVNFQLINQRSDFSFALFSGGLSNPKVVAVSNSINFVNPKAHLYPRHAHG